MTFKEKLRELYPTKIKDTSPGCGVEGCPIGYGLEDCVPPDCNVISCTSCWDREYPDKNTNNVNKGEKEMPTNYNEVKVNTRMPCEEAHSTISEDAMKLYDLLLEIQGDMSRLGSMLFGTVDSDQIAAKPDCLKSNISMALNTAHEIRVSLLRIRDGLGG